MNNQGINVTQLKIVRDGQIKMPLTYKNRKGDIYYLKKKETPKGKTRYVFAKSMDGSLLSHIPEGYEIYEHPDARVFLRKKVISKITSEEIDLCKNRLPERANVIPSAVIIDYRRDDLTVYFSESVANAPDIAKGFHLDPQNTEALTEMLFRQAIYLPVFKFRLIDEQERVFTTERYCFLGGIDDWMTIGHIDTLPALLDTLGAHLGKESFYELF
jgi:hypothetical protein